MRHARGTCLAVLAALLPACDTDTEGSRNMEITMQNATHILESSRQPDELEGAALLLAASRIDEHQTPLRRSLSSAAFLDQLDPDAEELVGEAKLRVERVLETLAENDADAARQTLIELTRSREFTDHPDRAEFLIQACIPLRPAPPDVVKFWHAQCHPLNGQPNGTMRAVVENGSEPALRVLEATFADPQHEEQDKIYWLRNYVLPHRNDAPLLESCHRMLASPLLPDVRAAMIDVLFDDRPAEWFRPGYVVRPPQRAEAGEPARAELRNIAKTIAERNGLTETQKRAMTATLAELDQPPTPQAPQGG